MLWTGGYIPNQNLGKLLRGTEKLWNYLLTLHYEDVADFTQSWSSNKKKRAFDICFDPGSEKRSELDDRSRQIGTLYMPKIDSDVIIVQLRGGM